MTEFLLLRHAEADYSKPMKWKTPGWGADLAPLSDRGIEQAKNCAAEIQKWNPNILLCSPTTRTLQTALIVQSFISIPFEVEFDLHEWVPHRKFQWTCLEDVQKYEREFESLGGMWPQGEEKTWESLSMVRERVISVLNKYTKYKKVVVICHGIVIQSLTGRKNLQNAQSIVYNFMGQPDAPLKHEPKSRDK
jgi:uncharacterized phosphatase